MKKSLAIMIISIFGLSACVHNGQNDYNWSDVGRPTVVEFGKVVAARSIHITGENTGAGAVAGGIGGAAIARNGDGRGALAGLLIGAIAGAITEQELANRTGTEYIIALRNHKVITVVQEIHDEDPIFSPGTRVIVQTSGNYQRVLSAETLPTQIHRAKGIKQLDDDDDSPAVKHKQRPVKQVQPDNEDM